MNIRALIAEDEPILAATLARTLHKLWPELEIAGTAANGVAAVEQALALRPDVLFLDIRMPGQTGIEAAEELAERWDGPSPFPHVVFVTAYDDYAVQAFEQAAADYVLKPVNETRLARTVERLQGLLAGRRIEADPLARLVDRLQALLPDAAAPAGPRLDFVRAAVGNVVRMIPVAEVVYFQAADKYVLLGVANDVLWRKFCALAGLEAYVDDPRFRTNADRVRHRAATVELVQATIATRTCDEWMRLLADAGIPAAPINSFADVMAHPHTRDSGMVLELPHPAYGQVKAMAQPIVFDGARNAPKSAAPLHGEHTRAILESLGYSASDIRRLQDEGAVYVREPRAG